MEDDRGEDKRGKKIEMINNDFLSEAFGIEIRSQNETKLKFPILLQTYEKGWGILFFFFFFFFFSILNIWSPAQKQEGVMFRF